MDTRTIRPDSNVAAPAVSRHRGEPPRPHPASRYPACPPAS